MKTLMLQSNSFEDYQAKSLIQRVITYCSGYLKAKTIEGVEEDPDGKGRK